MINRTINKSTCKLAMIIPVNARHLLLLFNPLTPCIIENTAITGVVGVIPHIKRTKNHHTAPESFSSKDPLENTRQKRKPNNTIDIGAKAKKKLFSADLTKGDFSALTGGSRLIIGLCLDRK
jgi:hypothetical protein